MHTPDHRERSRKGQVGGKKLRSHSGQPGGIRRCGVGLGKRVGRQGIRDLLRSPGDFAEESFNRMLVNACHWAVDKELPGANEKVSTWKIQRADKKKKRK